MAGRGLGVLPLYDGFAPPPRYRFVNPPPSLADGNKVPVPTRTVVRLEPGGSVEARAASDDDQLVVNLPAGAIPAAAPNTMAAMTITPVDPATLAPLPEGASPEGNGFRVDIAYLPDTSRSAASRGSGRRCAHLAPCGREGVRLVRRSQLDRAPDGPVGEQADLVPPHVARLRAAQRRAVRLGFGCAFDPEPSPDGSRGRRHRLGDRRSRPRARGGPPPDQTESAARVRKVIDAGDAAGAVSQPEQLRRKRVTGRQVPGLVGVAEPKWTTVRLAGWSRMRTSSKVRPRRTATTSCSSSALRRSGW